jgi:septal ring factor EnvC (AmiA/AmiB activator)
MATKKKAPKPKVHKIDPDEYNFSARIADIQTAVMRIAPMANLLQDITRSLKNLEDTVLQLYVLRDKQNAQMDRMVALMTQVLSGVTEVVQSEKTLLQTEGEALKDLQFRTKRLETQAVTKDSLEKVLARLQAIGAIPPTVWPDRGGGK